MTEPKIDELRNLLIVAPKSTPNMVPKAKKRICRKLDYNEATSVEIIGQTKWHVSYEHAQWPLKNRKQTPVGGVKES